MKNEIDLAQIPLWVHSEQTLIGRADEGVRPYLKCESVGNEDPIGTKPRLPSKIGYSIQVPFHLL